ncbi:MAG: hypothetical protein IJD39_03140 [Clostridia bacterium]|nr:hypothetical protein [Clostridia bacterium]
MKKLISLLLALLLITGACLAEPMTEEAAYPTYEELEIYLSALRQRSLEGSVEITKADNGDTLAIVSEGLLRIADETLDKNTAVLGAVLDPTAACPRGLMIGDSLSKLLSTYPNHNPDLAGNYNDAALYISGSKPEAVLGWVLRDGQRVTQVTHCIYHWVADGVISCGVSYQIDNDMIVNIAVFGMDQRIDETQALQEIADTAEIQEATHYFAYPKSEDGSLLAPFVREDLSFGGLDFLDLTPEMATAVLGSSPVDEWKQDSSGEYLRIRQWDGVSIYFNYDSSKQFKQVNSMLINGDTLEGPRGVRVGDSMESVMYRFSHGQGGTVDNGIALYGDGVNAPFGILAYGETTATINYALSPDGEALVHWQLTFVGGKLQEMRMLLR